MKQNPSLLSQNDWWQDHEYLILYISNIYRAFKFESKSKEKKLAQRFV